MPLRTKSITDSIRFEERAPDGSILVDWQPGNMTSYKVLFQPTSWMSQSALDLLGWQEGTVMVQVLSFPSQMYPAAPHGYLQAEYLMEKMGLRSISDAKILAELIALYLPTRSADNAKEKEFE